MRRLLLLALITLLWGPAIPALAASEAEVNARIEAVLGDATRYEATIKAFQQAVATDARQDVAAFVRYPLVVRIDGHKRTIRSAKAFLDRYEAIMTPAVVAAVKGQPYGDLFVNSHGIMFGNGEVWINGICLERKCKRFVPKVVTIQAAAGN